MTRLKKQITHRSSPQPCSSNMCARTVVPGLTHKYTHARTERKSNVLISLLQHIMRIR